MVHGPNFVAHVVLKERESQGISTVGLGGFMCKELGCGFSK